MCVFPYGQAEIAHLRQNDDVLGAAIDRIGPIERSLTPDVFAALVLSVVGQQISNKAAETVGRRLTECVGTLSPAHIVDKSVEELQQCGLSFRKVAYIRGIAEAARDGTLDIAALPAMTDDAVIRHLTALPGIGVWTAEMLLIFSLARPDVVSWGDLAIRRGMARLYERDELTRADFDRIRARYSPYGTVASLYLWEIARDN